MKTKQLTQDPREIGVVCCICCAPTVPMLRIMDKRIVKQYPGYPVRCDDPECKNHIKIETYCTRCGKKIEYIMKKTRGGRLRLFCKACKKENKKLDNAKQNVKRRIKNAICI